ncbi:MAG: hypothetical protein QW342_02850 [Thermoproteota archaeon]
MSFSNSDQEIIFKKGLTWKVVTAIVVSSLLFVPASIYLSMVAGGTLSFAATLLMVITFSELSRLLGEKLSRQETLAMYEALNLVSSLGAGGIGAYWIIFRLFFIESPISWAYKINNIPLPLLVPSWLAPSKVEIRTLFQPSMVIPILVYLTFSACYLLAEFSLTMMFAPLFLETEKLPFPFAKIDVGIVDTLSSRDFEQTRIFITFLYPGALYGIFVIMLPILANITFIPLPWVDLTSITDAIIPGAIIGVATDLMPWATGLIVPLNAAISIFIGSILIWIFGNNIFLTSFPNIFPKWVAEYRRGMNISLIWQRSLYRVWFAPQIGFGLGISFMVFILTFKNILKVMKVMITEKKKTSLYPNFLMLLALFVFGTSFSALVHSMLTSFPLYISLIYSVGLSFLFALANSTTLGMTGYSISIPYLWATLVYYSDYRSYSGWVISPVLAGSSTPGMLNTLKAAYLTETYPMDVIKALVLGVIASTIIGTLSLDLFWRMAPIPSSMFPFTTIDWARTAIGDSLLITRQIDINPKVILFSALSSGILSGLFEISNRLFSLPLSGPGLIAGFFTLPPYAIATLISSIIGNLLIPKVVKKESWDKVKGTVVAGLAAGYGLVIGFTIALFFVLNSGWIWPW